MRFSVVLLGLLGSATPALATEPVVPQKPHLSTERVAKLAAAALSRVVKDTTEFVVGDPKYIAERHVWWVVYEVPSVLDAGEWVVIDDRTGKACVQAAAVINGPCAHE